MVFRTKTENGNIVIKKEMKELFDRLGDCEVEVRIEKIKSRRTFQQNAALHLYFTLLAEALNNAGWDIKKTIRPGIDVPWTKDSVKELLWRPVQEAYLRKHSTTELDKVNDIDKIYDIINRTISERTGVSVPFPSIENLYEDSN